MNDESAPDLPLPEAGLGGDSNAVRPGRTPMYAASHGARYQRQALINQINEARPGCSLICYISGSRSSVVRDDIVFFVDLLRRLKRGGSVDLLLHTPGGDIDAAEKLMSMVQSTVQGGMLRVVVPDFAKSAGTLMALGADEIVMSDSSELGPIDPQVALRDDHGNSIQHSVQSYLDAYKGHAAALRRDPSDLVATIMLNKLDPATLKVFEAVRDRARRFAEKQLQYGMFRSKPGNFTRIPDLLIDTERWPSHGQMIGWQEATEMGLTVRYLDPSESEWQAYWQLYCLQRLAITDRQKLFESDYVSLSVDSPD